VSDRALVGKIVRLLESDDVERQRAAALVLGEIGVKDPAVVDALVGLLASTVTSVQRQALLALGSIGSRKALPALLPMVQARDAAVRDAAFEAVSAFAEEAVPLVKARLAETPPAERRPMEELLARLGGRDALSSLLAGLPGEEFEAARAAILPLRHRLKDADARERKRALEQATKLLDDKKSSAAARLAACKVLGYVGDPVAAPRLLAVAESKDDENVREEAVIALRLVGSKGLPPRIIEGLVALAEKAPLRVARTALYSLAGGGLPAKLGRRLGKVAGHGEAARALIAIELLAGIPGTEAADALATTLIATDERARAEAAANALAKRPEAAAALAGALVETKDRDRAEMVAHLLRPHLGKLDRKSARKVVDSAVARLEGEDPSAEALLQISRTADAEATAKALRDLASQLRKARKPDRALKVLRVLGRSREAAPDDGYALAALELTHGLKDEAFTVIGQLADQGYDVGMALRKDRTLEDRHRYEIGFHFIERDHPLGEETLNLVAETAGRSKLGQMARAKLKSAGLA
jgi:HEAT repeat protein